MNNPERNDNTDEEQKSNQFPSIMERFRLDGKVALITGGSQGIGRAFAYALGEMGAIIIIIDIDNIKGNILISELKNKNIDSLFINCDVTNQIQVESMIKQIIDTYGKLDIAINNAGKCNWSDMETMDYNNWKDIIDLNLNGVFLCCQAEIKEMLKKGYGKIINTASMSGHITNFPQHQCHYNTAKAAVLHLTKSLAVEFASRGICINSISPGYTKSQLLIDVLSTPEGQGVEPTWKSLIPMGRFAEVSDLQGAVVFLAAPVSDYMTGSDIVIDGGYCCM